MSLPYKQEQLQS